MTAKSIPSGILVAVAMLQLPAASLAESPPAVPVFTPAEAEEPEPDQPLLRGQTWVDEKPQYAIRLQLIDDAQRLAYIKHVTGVTIDPFASPPDKEERFLTFLLEIENRGGTSLSFNPGSSWLVPNRGDLRSPYGLNDLGFDYRSSDQELPPAYERVGPAVLEAPLFIAPGESTAGLLLFRSVPPKTKSMQLDLKLTLPNGDAVEFSAPYKRSKDKS